MNCRTQVGLLAGLSSGKFYLHITEHERLATVHSTKVLTPLLTFLITYKKARRTRKAFFLSFYLTSRFRGLFFHVSTHSHTTTVGKTPLDGGSARRRDLYLTTHNTHNKQTSMTPAGFKPAILPGDRLQTHALDLSATGIGTRKAYRV